MRSTPHILVVNGVKIRRPVFILGAPQSGTDLLARALKRAGETHLTMGRPGVLRVTYAFARRPSMATEREHGAARVLRDAYAREWQITPDACAECPRECRDLSGPLVAGTCAPEQGVQRYGDATPDLLYSADVLLDAFPDAQLVQVIRDGRDAVAEMIDDPNCLAWFRPGVANLNEVFPNPFLGVETEHERARWSDAGPTVKCALRWRGSVRLSAKLHAQAPREQLLTVRFEELLTDPGKAASALSEYLGQDIPKSAFAGISVRDGETGQGRARLSGKQIAVVERIAGRELRRLGYPIP